MASSFSNPDLSIHRVIAAWAADCAERVLPLFEVERPHDRRPREAIDALRAWTRGEQTMPECRVAAFAAHAAAREATSPIAVAAARAAGQACSVAHMFTHAPHAAVYAAKAVTLAHGNQAGDVEREWQESALPTEARAALGHSA